MTHIDSLDGGADETVGRGDIVLYTLAYRIERARDAFGDLRG